MPALGQLLGLGFRALPDKVEGVYCFPGVGLAFGAACPSTEASKPEQASPSQASKSRAAPTKTTPSQAMSRQLTQKRRAQQSQANTQTKSKIKAISSQAKPSRTKSQAAHRKNKTRAPPTLAGLRACEGSGSRAWA